MTNGPSTRDQSAGETADEQHLSALPNTMPGECLDNGLPHMADTRHSMKASPSPTLRKALAAAFGGDPASAHMIDEAIQSLPPLSGDIEMDASALEMDSIVSAIGMDVEEEEEEEVQAMKDVAMELVQGGILDDLDEGNGSDSLFGSNGSFAEQMHASMNQFNTPQLTPLQSPAVGNHRSSHHGGTSHGAVDDFGTTLEELDVVSSGSVLDPAPVLAHKVCSETEESSDDEDTDSGDEDAELQLIHLFEGDWCDIAWRWDWLALQYAEAKHHLLRTERRLLEMKKNKRPVFRVPDEYQGCARTLQFNNRSFEERPELVHKVPTKVILRTKFEPHPLSASDKNFAHRVALRAPSQPKPSQLKLPNSPYLRRSVPSPSSLRSRNSPRTSTPRQRDSVRRSRDSARRSVDNTLDQIVLPGSSARKIRKIEYREIFTPSFRQIDGVEEGVEDAASSDEDTSDEMYMRLHAPKEEAEHARFVAACGEDPQKKRSRRGNSNQQKPSAEEKEKATKGDGPPRKLQRLTQSMGSLADSPKPPQPKAATKSTPKTISDSVYITSREVESPRASPKTPAYYDLPVRKSSRPHKPSSLRRKLDLSPKREASRSCSSLRDASTSIPTAGEKRRREEEEIEDDDESNAWKIARTEEEGKKNVLVLRKISVP